MSTDAIKPIDIEAIRTDGGTQIRAELSEPTLKEYAEARKAGAKFPPVVVYYDGATYWLADGFHRYWSAKRAGSKQIRCEVWHGTQREAILHAVGANHEHGLRRSNEDKRKAVMTLLEDEEWAKKSDKWIADTARVSPHSVKKIRTDHFANAKCDERETADGRTMNTANIGRRADEGDADGEDDDGYVSYETEETDVVDTSTGEVLEDAEIVNTKTTRQRMKHTETHEVSDAMQFATIAISQLERISEDDPQRTDALDKVSEWITQHRSAE